MLGKPHQNRPDASNLLKSVEDALMPEDSKIWQIYCVKRWGEQGQISIVPMESLYIKLPEQDPHAIVGSRRKTDRVDS